MTNSRPRGRPSTDEPEPGKIAAAGCRLVDRNAIDPAPYRPGDKGMGEWRNCSRCGTRFEKTLVRRMLCGNCYRRASEAPEAA